MILHEEVRKSADIGDVEDLKYIFVDCLDVDPTFEKYLDDYNYCVKKGLFEPHKNLNDFSNRQADWNDDYWQILKRDLLKNFSRERLDHMRKVALVVLADKVARLRQERQQQTRQTAASPISQPIVQQRPANPPPFKSKAEQDREIEALRQKLAQDDAEAERQQKLQQQELERRRQENSRRQSEVTPPKKSTGIAPVIIIAAVAAVVIFVLLK